LSVVSQGFESHEYRDCSDDEVRVAHDSLDSLSVSQVWLKSSCRMQQDPWQSDDRLSVDGCRLSAAGGQISILNCQHSDAGRENSLFLLLR
jgi:hypothetical protein